MTTRTSLEIGTDFVTAFGRGDMETVRSLVADDIEFTSPRTRIAGAGPFLTAIAEFAQAVRSVDIVASFGSVSKR